MSNVRELRLETINTCNAKCVMCPRSDMTRTKGTMDEKLAKSLIEQSISAGVEKICFGRFGEPLLDPRLFDFIRYARSISKTVVTYFFTNGSLLKKRADEIMNSGVTMVKVSMSSLRKEVYESIAKGIKFEDVKEGLKTLLGQKQREWRLGEPSLPGVGLVYISLPENKGEDVREFQRYWDWQGVDMFSFWRPHNWNKSKDYRLNGPRVRCDRPRSGTMEVDVDGKVVPCCFDFNSELVLGDLTKQTIEEALESKKVKDFADLHARAVEDESVMKGHFCENCHERSVDVRPFYAVGWNV